MARPSVVPLPEFDLWSVPSIQNSIEKDIITEHRPEASLSQSANILGFNIVSSENECIKLNESELSVAIKLTGKGCDESDAWTKVGLANNTLSSIFSDVRVYIGTNQVTFNNQHYPYISYFQALFGSGQTAKKTHMLASGWANEDGGDLMKSTINTTRQQLIKTDGNMKTGYAECFLYGKIYTELALQQKVLPAGTKLRLEFVQNKADFYIHSPNLSSGKSINAEIVDATFYAHKSVISRELQVAHTHALNKAPCRIQVNHIECKAFTLDTGRTDFKKDNIALGKLPRRMTVAMVDTAGFYGSHLKNPFYFENNNVNYICSFLNGIQYPCKAYMPKFDDGNYLREYVSLFENLNMDGGDTPVQITRNMFEKGFCMFSFNYAPDLSDGAVGMGHINEDKRGTLRLDIKFENPLTKIYTLVCFLEYDGNVFIDSNKNGYHDFTYPM